MALLNRFGEWLSRLNGNRTDVFEIRSRDLIYAISPHETATLNVPRGYLLRLTGLTGVIWVTTQGELVDYLVRNGDEFEIKSSGLFVMQSMTSHVPGRIRVAIKRDRNHTRQIQ